MDYNESQLNRLEDTDAGGGGEYQVNRELLLARRIVEETGANLFLTGKAGTGKTTFLRRIRETTRKRMVVLAPSGVAAINANGQTIHSFFLYPMSIYVPGQGFIGERRYSGYRKERRRLMATMDLLVIDEISMVRADLLDAIDASLRRQRHSSKPFGGVQLLLIGDLRQLSPVVTDADREVLKRYYASPYFFESKALRQAGFLTVELSTIYRQTDHEFIEMLNAVRDGKVTPQMLANLNARYRPGFNPPDSEGYIRLTTHNARAAQINGSRLRELNAMPYTFEAVVQGKFPESSFPAERVLTLKKGSQVMFIKNDTGQERRFFNGMIGTVTSISRKKVIVTPIDGSEPIEVEEARWDNTRYTVDETTKAITQEIEGSFIQLPLRLAWAITIHKSQGLTFDHAIIDAASSFAPGQAYVALSRCRNLEGMVLEREIPLKAVMTDTAVDGFIEQGKDDTIDDERIMNLRGEYGRMIIAELFDFSKVKMAFDDYNRAVEEYVLPLHRHLGSRYREASKALEEKIVSVGQRFARIYAAKPLAVDSGAEAELLGKIRNGCRYFLDEMEPICELINETPRNLENKKYRKRLDNAFQELIYPLSVSLHILSAFSQRDFSVSDYMEVKAKAVLDAEDSGLPERFSAARKSKVKTEKKERQPREMKEKKPKGYSQFQSLEMYRQGKTVEEIAAERGLAKSTIAGHLAEAVKNGDIEMDALVSPEHRSHIEEAFENNTDFKAAVESLDDDVPEYEVSILQKLGRLSSQFLASIKRGLRLE